MRMPLGTSAIVTIVLVVLNLAVLGLVGRLLLKGTQVDYLRNTSAGSIEAPLSIPEFPLLNTDFKIIRTRTLFYSSREYYVAPDPVMQELVLQRPDYKLAGILAMPNKPRIALLASADGKNTRKLKEGDSIDGWLVKAVEPDKVVLAIGTRIEEFARSKPSAGVGAVRTVGANTQAAQSPTGVRALGGNHAVAASSPTAIIGSRLYRPQPP